MEFFTRFNLNPDRHDFVPVGKSMTQQQFQEQSDVNWIIAHYQEIPQNALGSVEGPRVPLWGDFSGIPDLQTAHKVFEQAEASFMGLSSELRLRFNNNPLELLAFVSDSANREEAVKLGLIDPAAPAPAVIPKTDPVAAVNAETVQDQQS